MTSELNNIILTSVDPTAAFSQQNPGLGNLFVQQKPGLGNLFVQDGSGNLHKHNHIAWSRNVGSIDATIRTPSANGSGSLTIPSSNATGTGSATSQMNCLYCDRQFHFKDLYVQHIATCEFFYRSRHKKNRDNDLHEQLPSAQEQFKLIQYLTMQVNKLQKDLIQLKGETITRKRKVIMEWLHSPDAPKPTLAFDEWIKTIPICAADLDKVFTGDLVEGMKHCLTTYFGRENSSNAHVSVQQPTTSTATPTDTPTATATATAITQLPICSFVQKPGTIYVWAAEPGQIQGQMQGQIQNLTTKWRIMDSDMFERWMNRLAHGFLQEFIKWQVTNSVQINSSDENKEKNVDNLRKVNGLRGKSYEDRRRAELHKWLFGVLAKDFTQQMIVYDIV